MAKHPPIEMGLYISLDVLYYLPIIQTARLAAIYATRRFDPHSIPRDIPWFWFFGLYITGQKANNALGFLIEIFIT